MGTPTEVALIQSLHTGRSALQQKTILHTTLLPMSVPDEPGISDQL